MLLCLKIPCFWEENVVLKNIVLSILVVGIFLSVKVFAQADLDMSFGSAGSLIVSGQIASGDDVVTQADSKIVMISSCTTSSNVSFPFCTVRLNENGSRDTSFGANGVVYTNIPGSSGSPIGRATGIEVQNDGKLVLTGYAKFSGQERVVLLRYNSNGSLDSSFGTGGIVVTDVVPSNNSRGKKVVTQPDGKILVVGYAASRLFVARYTTDGTLDDTFGSGGTAVISESSTFGNSIELQPDGRILAGGNAAGGSPGYLLARFNPDGSPDTTWNGDGILHIGSASVPPPDGGIIALAVQRDGRVVALGQSNILYSFTADGSLDTSFDGDGSRIALPGSSDPFDMTLSAGGRITVVGSSQYTFSGSGGPLLYLVARYLGDGSPDQSLDGDGFVMIDATNVNDGALSVTKDPFGRIVIGGHSAGGTVHFPFELNNMSVARLLAPPPVPVGILGRVIRANGSAASNVTVALGLNGTTLATSRTNPFGYYSFDNVMTGAEYTVSIKARGSAFPQQHVFVADEVTGLDIAEGSSKDSPEAPAFIEKSEDSGDSIKRSR